MNPTTVLPDPVLTRLAVEYGTGGPFVADIIAPVAMVEKDLFKYRVWGREHSKLDVRSKRAPGAPAGRVTFAGTFATGTVAYHSLKTDIPDEVRNNDPNGDSLGERAVKVLVNKLRLRAENAIATLVEAATNTRMAPGTKWDNSGTIRKDILGARETFRRQAGVYPTHIVVPPIVMQVIKNDSQILDLLKYTNGGLLANGRLPTLEGMVVVDPGAILDTANPGAAVSIADVWDKDEVYYLFVDSAAGNDLSSGQTALRQVRSMATGGTPYSVRNWRDPDPTTNTEWFACECNQIELVITQDFILRQLDVLT